MGKPTPRDEMPLQPQVTFEPFEKWGMDFVGPINTPSKQKSYIIVCTNYLRKWAETKAIKGATEEKVSEFLRENIFYKFGYQRESQIKGVNLPPIWLNTCSHITRLSIELPPLIICKQMDRWKSLTKLCKGF